MTAPALTQTETGETFVSDEAARAEYIAAARSAAWRRRLLPVGAAILLLVLWELAVVVFHVTPVHRPGADRGRRDALRQIRAPDRQSRADRDRSGRRIHHRQCGGDRHRHRLRLSAHRRGGVLSDRGDGSHDPGHGLCADPGAAARQRAQRQGRHRRADLLLSDAGQYDAGPARRQPAANGADAHPLG